jgi:NhaP-type Na+/H+ or K+/H+ antiporter
MSDISWITMPWALRPDTLLGAALLAVVAALLGELAWRLLRWPRLMGALVVGSLLALAGLGAGGDEPALRLAVDMALALLLFEAGARVDLRWFARNRWLLATSALEALGAALAVWVAARLLGLPGTAAVPLALIALCVSPAVIQRVVGECHAAGQVSERLLALATMNTLMAIVLLQLYSAGVLLTVPDTWLDALPLATFSFFGSLLLGVALGEGIGLIARRLDLRDDHAAVLVLACVLLALVGAKTLSLSTLLVPLLAGLWLRNRTERPWVWPRHFGSAGSALVLLMFIAVASAPSPQALLTGASIAIALLAVRAAAKTGAVFALARPSGLSMRQAAALSAGLLPMSASAWVLGLDYGARHPDAAAVLMPVLLAMLAGVELLSPLLLRASLQWAGEIDPPRVPAPKPAPPADAPGLGQDATAKTTGKAAGQVAGTAARNPTGKAA